MDNNTSAEYFTMLQKEEEKKLSKKQLKKLAKGKKIKKEKPKWNLEGSKKKTKTLNLEENVVFVNKTPPGEKKDFSSNEIAEKYNSDAVESAWDLWWEKQGYYTCDLSDVEKLKPEEKFVMMLPPPNVTGTLHIGHALMVTIEDTLARYNRMLGKKVMWLPGTDHAGIGTQAVVEAKLWKTEQKRRFDFTREEFVKKCWEWTDEKGGKIIQQMRRLGASLDHSRTVFTLDELRYKAVMQAFVKMYDMGLIYRKKRLVNWSCALGTALSNIEVDTKELEKRTLISIKTHGNKKYEFGVLTEFKYPVVDSDETVTVATTRLETMLGDVAVCVHSDDERYKHLHGKYVKHPFFDRKLPIICDNELVDMSFGTGCVKITPAHDENDYSCGERHNLPMLNMLSDDGHIDVTECKAADEGQCLGDKFHGMMRYDARKAIEEELEKLGLLGEKKDNKMILPICSKSGDVVEPRLKEQWWIDTVDMARRSIEAVDKGDLEIIPSFHVATWKRYLTDPHQWCISRQLWWGHRIPAYKIVGEAVEKLAKANKDSEWIIAVSETEAKQQLKALCSETGVSEAGVRLEQDEDVLDTWFSSGIFPFSTLGWPEETNDLKQFFPGTLLETGHDILFFWVARMVMMSLTLHDKLPFKTVYLHAMVRDRFGRKMSKSLGNIIDPLAVINGCTLKELNDTIINSNLPEKEIKKAIKGQNQDYPDGIPKCGSDALRFGLLSNINQGRDVNLDVNNVFSTRKFCNKLWQVVRFSIGICGSDFVPDKTLDFSKQPLSVRDKWILNEVKILVEKSNSYLETYYFGEYTSALMNFWLNKLCDVYIESIKPLMKQQDLKAEQELTKNVLFHAIDTGLKLMHPVMPYLTEELWNNLPGVQSLLKNKDKSIKESLMISSFPSKNDISYDFSEQVEIFETANKICHDIRSLKSDYNITNKNTMIILFVQAKLFNEVKLVKDDIEHLSGCKITLEPDDKLATFDKKGYLTKVIDSSLQIMMEIKGNVDIKDRITKLTKEKKKQENSLSSLEKKLTNEKFLKSAPEQILNDTKAKLEDTKGIVEKLTKQIADLTLLEQS